MYGHAYHRWMIRHGFTLIEILIVVVILGILAAMVIPKFADARQETEINSIKSSLQTLRSQIELYRVQHGGELPESLDDLVNADPSYIIRNPNETVPFGYEYDYDAGRTDPSPLIATCTAANTNCPPDIDEW